MDAFKKRIESAVERNGSKGLPDPNAVIHEMALYPTCKWRTCTRFPFDVGFNFRSICRLQAVKIMKHPGWKRTQPNCIFRRIFLTNWCRTHFCIELFYGKCRICNGDEIVKLNEDDFLNPFDQQTPSKKPRYSDQKWQKPTAAAIRRTAGQVFRTRRYGSSYRFDYGKASHSRR